MMELLGWFENTGLSVWIRESVSLWAYPGMLSFHTFGLAFLVGVSMAFDLRILGFANAIPLVPLKKFFVVMWIGFWVNAVSGGLLWMANATTTTLNPIYIIKMVFVVLAVVLVFRLKRVVYDSGDAPDVAAATSRARRMAIASLCLWFAAIVTGRFVAYLDLVKGMLS
jgi:hypothetical protein